MKANFERSIRIQHSTKKILLLTNVSNALGINKKKSNEDGDTTEQDSKT